MKRKHFISKLIATGLSFPAIGSDLLLARAKRPRLATPPYLLAGSTIGITCPAGYISNEEIQPAVQMMKSWGFNIILGNTVGMQYFTLGGTDQDRAADFQQMLDNPDIHAIMCARGGYGAVRIVDKLDFSQFRKHPKWIIGFSDITVFHCHLNRNFNIASIHSKMCNSFPADLAKADTLQMDTILSIKKALLGERSQYFAPYNQYNRLGRARAELVGGNLSIIQTLAGSNSDIATEGKILFLEDTGEHLYNIDRMFFNLKRSGKLSKLAGLLIGGFNLKADEPGDEFGKTIQDIVLEKVKEYNYPVCFDFPVGHQKNNFALKIGLEHELTVNELGAALQS